MPRKNEIDYLEEIAAKTGSATITGPVTVTNEVEIKNDANNPLPVSDNNSSLTVDGTVELGATSLAALENISVTFPSSQNVSVQNASLAVTGPLTNTELRAAAIPVSLATAPTTPVTGTFFQTTQPVSGPLTNTELRATAVPVSGTVTANTGLTPLTDTQLRATAVPVSLATAPTTPVTGTFWQATQPVSIASAPVTPVTDNGGSLTVDGTVTANVSGTVPVSGTFWQTTQPISGTVTANTGLTQPLTDTQLRATAVPVSGTVTANTGLAQPLTDTQLRATAVPVSGTVTANTGLTQPLTDTQLRATAVPVSGTFFQTTQPVSGPLTDTQLRATALTVTDRGTTGPATVTNFSATSNTSIAASNSARKLLTIFNEGAGILYVLYGNGTATTSNYSVRINSGDYLEIDKYTGAVFGLFGSAGTAKITEIT